MTNLVFISYSRNDRAYVERLAAMLQRSGLAVWYDYELEAGDRFDRVIAQRISDATAVVVVLTPTAAASEWVSLELSYARKLGRPIFPLMLQRTEMPFLIHNIHYEDVTSGQLPDGRFLRRIADGTASPPIIRDVPAMREVPVTRKQPTSYGLTARELRVAALVATGGDIAQIAEQLGLPERMVADHIASIFRKTGVRHWEDLARLYGRSAW